MGNCYLINYAYLPRGYSLPIVTRQARVLSFSHRIGTIKKR